MQTDKSNTLQKCVAVAVFLACELLLNPPNTAAQSSKGVAISQDAARIGTASATRPRYSNKSVHAEKSSTDRRQSVVVPGASSLRNRLKECAKNSLCLRLLAEYGAMFAANPGKVRLPPRSFFRNEAEVQKFQRLAGILSEVIDGFRVELQPHALKAFMAARSEARQRKLNINPRGTHSSRRSYSNTVSLWRLRVNAALSYWVSRGKITRLEAENLRSLSIEKQVLRVLALESRKIYFGTGFGKSILHSVSAPGASQHNAMLALDVEQYDNAQVQVILARHGWFQTVKNDAPHFTYLGVEESRLPSRGLKRDTSSGSKVWVPNIAIWPKAAAIEDKMDGSTKTRSNATTTRKGSDASEDLEKDQGNSVKPTVAYGVLLNGTIGGGVTIQTKMRPLLHSLTENYFQVSRSLLNITSGYRSPEAQATAMYHNLYTYGRAHVLGTYGGRQAAVEIIGAYRRNSRSRSKAIKGMTEAIQQQVARGIYISRHMLGKAFDIRLSTAHAPTLRAVVRSLGGRLTVEADHYHVEF